MNINSLAPMALVLALSACGGNSLLPDETETETETDGEVTLTTAVTIPDDIKHNLTSAKVIPGTGGNPDTILIAISALDTTPIAATWERYEALDTPGFQAFKMQEDPLDRMFVALSATSADGSVSATMAGDGGQFNKVFQGVNYERVGGYTPPDATQSGPGRGQVSYSGKYAGMLNGGSDDAHTLEIPAERNVASEEIPRQATRVTGDVFMNANFADNAINGVVKNRVAIDLDLTDDVDSALYNDGSGVALEDVILAADGTGTAGNIAANGTFSGSTERPNNEDIGSYSGVVAGTNGSSVAGGLSLDVGKVYLETGDSLDAAAIERGAFVLNQCGLTATGGDCVGTAP